MKKKVVVTLLTICMFSMGLAGCSPSTEQTRDIPEIEESEESDDYDETSDEDEEETRAVSGRHLDSGWLEKVREYCYENQYSEHYGVFSYSEDIPGSFDVYADDDDIWYVNYTNVRGNSTISMNLHDATEEISVCIDLQYSDGTRFYIYGESLEYNQIEYFFDNLLTGSWDTLAEDSALEDHDVEADAKILYSRFINMSDVAFGRMDTTFEEYGIVLGDKYRNIDPTECLSEEVEIVNDHVFENGVCKDCDMNWTDYVRSAIAEHDLYRDDTDGWVSVYGPNGYFNMCPSDYVQLSADEGYVQLYYRNYAEDAEAMEFHFTAYGYNLDEVSLLFSIDDEYYPIKQGVVTSTYTYGMRIECAPSEVADIISSKDRIMDEAEFYVVVDKEDGDGSEWYDLDLSDEEIEEIFADSECTYRSKEDVCNAFLERRDNFIDAFEGSLKYLDTSFADYGMTY